MASIHETRAVALKTDAAAISPVFLPLADLTVGTQLLPSQCTLTVTGAASPLEVAVMLCAPGTLLGDPGEAILAVGEVFNVHDGVPFALTGSVPALDTGGVLGLSVPVQGVPAGAQVKGTVSVVR